MNKYKVTYGYSHENDICPRFAQNKIFNTFDEAKKFIESLPKQELRLCYYESNETHSIFCKRDLIPLYAKIRCEGKDFWIVGNPNEVEFFKKCYLKRKNPKFKFFNI